MNIKQDLIPTSNRNRPGTRINPTHITIHETANRSRGADAATHARYVKGADAQNRSVSWHYTVDDKQIIQHLPNHEMGWHAGTNGNRQSIGIELCVNSDGDFEKTKANAQWLIRKLMSNLNIPVERVVTHKHWTGKNCPATLLPQFNNFKQGVITVTAQSNNTPSPTHKGNWEKATAKGIFNGERPKEPLTREQFASILNRLGLLD
ncbi:peptidoglycan recognition protein family protein [Halalkalibacterium ligniniphilum]|uniref:peptidoglycan recognition protein family protein n=1 Tax=Halalkalibacterium ligniniphilum TaxID=1134413 RepID=UPI000347E54E|nr:N-acetylmuramoyl-L-alanine amidase [Halalkalibacterium ligniniphilum]